MTSVRVTRLRARMHDRYLRQAVDVYKTTLLYLKKTFESSSDDATEAPVSDDLVEAITNRRQSDVDVNRRSHFRLHLRTQRQPTR